MDGRGRLAQSLTWIAPWRARPSVHGRAASRAHAGRRVRAARAGLAGRRFSAWIFNLRVPSGVGVAASGLFLLATLAYAIVVGDRIPTIVAALEDARDAAANAAGVRIASIALSGEKSSTERTSVLGWRNRSTRPSRC